MTEQYLALYRKYRPATFDDVAGQEKIVTLLQNAIKNNKVAHAYLFCGGRGTGKTTVARIFAREIGCNDEDIIELDAASNRGIDEVRELRDAVRTAPFSSPYKVYIVDEAHMLTKEAANALLKTLEEPPSHVIFILATTDPEKLPVTIVSRCQKVIFTQPDTEVLANRLSYVAQQEGRKVDDRALSLIASHGKRSYRDALGVLEQLLTFSDSAITYEHAVKHLGVVEKDSLIAILEAMCMKDSTTILTHIKSLSESNTHAISAYDDYVELVREALLVRIGEQQSSLSTLITLAKEYPHTISSKTILMLLEKRHLLEVSTAHAWTAFLAVLLLSIEN